MSVVVMVDSGANLSRAMLKKYNIALLPYNITFKNGDSYRDIIEIDTNKELVKLIDLHNEFPRIDQTNKDEIEAYFRKYIDEGNDLLYISVSSKLSHAYSEVREVASRFDENAIEVIDSLNVGAGETLLVLIALDYLKKGHGLKQITNYLNQIKYLIKSCYSVGNCNYLCRDARSNEIKEKCLQFYNHIPIVEINKGEMVITCNAIEDKLALQVIKNMINDYSRNIDNTHMIISYSKDRENALKLKDFTIKLLPGIKIELVENSSVVFNNTGDNTLSVAFLIEKI